MGRAEKEGRGGGGKEKEFDHSITRHSNSPAVTCMHLIPHTMLTMLAVPTAWSL